jgi:hypothetical protein
MEMQGEILEVKGAKPVAWEGHAAAICIFVFVMITPTFGRSGPMLISSTLVMMAPYFVLALGAALLGGLGIVKGGWGHRLIALIACALGIVAFVHIFHAFMYVTYLSWDLDGVWKGASGNGAGGSGAVLRGVWLFVEATREGYVSGVWNGVWSQGAVLGVEESDWQGVGRVCVAGVWGFVCVLSTSGELDAVAGGVFAIVDFVASDRAGRGWDWVGGVGNAEGEWGASDRGASGGGSGDFGDIERVEDSVVRWYGRWTKRDGGA